MSASKLHIVGICGSLRKGSYNKGLLRAALEAAPKDMEIETFDLGGMPLFNQDLEGTPPEVVRQWRERLRAADGLLISTPEHNYGVPAALKNAIDWASRPYLDNVLKGKAVALMGASIGMGGTIRCQLALRQSFVWTETYCMLQPEFLAPNCTDRFDANGNLTDRDTREHLVKFLAAVAAWVRRMKQV
jgi:chromate reductase